MRKRKAWRNGRVTAGILLCAGAVFCAGCGAGNGIGQPGDAVSSEWAQELLKAQIRHYYGGVLSQITAAWQLPDGELDTSALSSGFGEMRDNHFAVTDIDGDGREEQIGYVDTWDKAFSEEWDEGQPFPDELDADGDGTLYQLFDGGGPTYDYEDYKYNKADYEAWYGKLVDGAEEITLPWQPMTYESYADFTPSYLKMLAEEASKERTDTAADLGLLILNEDHFLDVAQNLLSEKYGVALEQPDPDFEEWTVGKKDGKELFSFEVLNAGSIGYRGEKLEDVTIFGIYPGISVDGALEKLQAYGFYADSYPEVENCLVTGDGFGNISIWFSAEDNVVTDITVRPYCAFAG